MKHLLILFFNLIISEALCAQSFLTDTEPLEAGEALHRPLTPITPPSSNPLTIGFRELIAYYQEHISSNSVQRCPFELSCSNYAKHALWHYDFVGIAFFIDRYFFRENESLTGNYLLSKKNGRTKYDDSFYLHEAAVKQK